MRMGWLCGGGRGQCGGGCPGVVLTEAFGECIGGQVEGWVRGGRKNLRICRLCLCTLLRGLSLWVIVGG